jgi:hypothetical protein
MMTQVPVVRLAFDLMHFPSQVRSAREAPVPVDIEVLLRIAADDDEIIRQAIGASGQSREAVREAAGFFIEQVLLSPEADSYRVLGGTPSASNADLRRNMALLLRWLHPDVDPRGERSIFTARVTKAWSDLKTAERRAAYDRRLQREQSEALLRQKARRRRRRHSSMVRHQTHAFKFEETSLLRRLVFALFGRPVR